MEINMEALIMILWIVGSIVSLIGAIWFLIAAFRQSILWGLGCIFVPFVSLIFLIVHWRDAAKPFGVSLLGSIIIAVAAVIMPEPIQ